MNRRLVVVVRHGEAVPYADTDAQRPLTERGQAQARSVSAKLARYLAREGCHETLLLHSPYVRAMQTAELLNEDLAAPMTEVQGITPDDSPKSALKRLDKVISEAPGHCALVIVSHMPLVSLLHSLWLEGNTREAQGFMTAEARVISFTGPAAEGCASAEAVILP